ncbi:MAG: MOSC domain-containing protein [Dehalococcoidia bacterium]
MAAVCLSPTSGVPKHPQQRITVGPQGVEGDFHAGPFNRHNPKSPSEPNWRQVTLVAQEVLDELSAQLGIELKSGDLGENILVAGLGDLSQLQKGDRLLVSSDVVLEVTAQNRPCDTIRVYHPTLVEEITGMRGVTAVVVTPGTVRPGDGCRALRTSPAESPQS